jgi:F-type H+-transporting ATPase subunit delta
VKHAPGALVARYSRALFAAARDLNALEPVHADLQALSVVWTENPELPLLLANPRLSRSKLRAILMDVCGKIKAHDVTRHFLGLLLDKNRLDILADTVSHFERQWQDHRNEIEVTVVTAVPVSDALQRTIREHLTTRSGKTPLITWNHDAALLGGLVIRWPDHIFDGSLARKLENMKAHLARSA